MSSIFAFWASGAFKSSAMFRSEFTAGFSGLFEVDDQTAFKCSGSGGRDGLSLRAASLCAAQVRLGRFPG